jgi:hypothetical protein
MVQYLYGFHDPGGEHLMGDMLGWVVVTEAIGHDASDHGGGDYRSLAPHIPIVRLNNGYHPDGTIPGVGDLSGFAQRCANFVAASQGCERWIIGNEPNHSQERPHDLIISPGYYAIAFNMCQERIKEVAPDARMIMAAIAPWNIESGDWIEYFQIILDLTAPNGIALHTYTHGAEPELVFSNEKMQSHPDRFYHFRAYRDFLDAVPEQWRSLPVYITETNQDAPWEDVNSGWVDNAYIETNDWNARGTKQQINALCLYRWPKYDQWHIDGKKHVQEDFVRATERRFLSPDENGGLGMVDWQIVFQTSMDEGFYDYQGIGELTVPVGSVPLWEHDGSDDAVLNRPEYDRRAVPHVHTAPNAAGAFTMFTTMEEAIVYEIACKPSDEVRASVWCNGVDGQQSGLGLRLGIATENPGAGAIEVQANDGKFAGVLEDKAVWGDWFNGRPDDVWEQVWTPVVAATGARVWIMLNARKDVSAPGHSHWDDLVVEIRGNGSGEPPTGTYTVVVYDPAGNEVARCPFEVAAVNPEICDLAQQIVTLACPGG